MCVPLSVWYFNLDCGWVTWAGTRGYLYCPLYPRQIPVWPQRGFRVEEWAWWWSWARCRGPGSCRNVRREELELKRKEFRVVYKCESRSNVTAGSGSDTIDCTRLYSPLTMSCVRCMSNAWQRLNGGCIIVSWCVSQVTPLFFFNLFCR